MCVYDHWACLDEPACTPSMIRVCIQCICFGGKTEGSSQGAGSAACIRFGSFPDREAVEGGVSNRSRHHRA